MRYFNQNGYIDGNTHLALGAFLRSDGSGSGINDDRSAWTPAAIADLVALIRAGVVIPTTTGHAFLRQLGVGEIQTSGGAGLSLGSLSSLLSNQLLLMGIGAGVGVVLGGRKPAFPSAIGMAVGWWLGSQASDGQTQAQKLIRGSG